MSKRLRFISISLLVLFCVLLPSQSFAYSCEDIFNTGSYRKNAWFTRAPSYVGCFFGSIVGAVIGIPVTAVYAPVYAACGEEDCEKLLSPINDSAEFGARVFSHAVALPFFIPEMLVTADAGEK